MPSQRATKRKALYLEGGGVLVIVGGTAAAAKVVGNLRAPLEAVAGRVLPGLAQLVAAPHPEPGVVGAVLAAHTGHMLVGRIVVADNPLVLIVGCWVKKKMSDEGGRASMLLKREGRGGGEGGVGNIHSSRCGLGAKSSRSANMPILASSPAMCLLASSRICSDKRVEKKWVAGRQNLVLCPIAPGRG